MPGLFFIPQSLLDGWLQEGLVDVTGAGLQLLAEGQTLPIEAACRFVGLLDGQDAAGLLDRVKTEPQLRALQAEPCGDSVLLGEVVYQVVPGFVASTPPPDPALRPASPGFIEAGATARLAGPPRGPAPSGRAAPPAAKQRAVPEEEEVELPAEFFSDDD